MLTQTITIDQAGRITLPQQVLDALGLTTSHETEVIIEFTEEGIVLKPKTSATRTMTFMLDGTLDDIFAALRRGEAPRRVAVPDCPCGHNPYLAYFRAGTQALHEALVLLQAEEPRLNPAERDAAFAALDGALRRVARREIETFAALCQHREREERTIVSAAALPGEALR